MDEDFKVDSSSEPCPLEAGRENSSSSEPENSDTTEVVTAPLYVPRITLARCSIFGKATRADKRRVFTKEELSILHERYKKNETIGRKEADLLASRFGSVTGSQIKTWFSNTRQQKKKEKTVAMKIRSSSPILPVPNAPKKNASSLKFDQPGPVPVALQNALFEEFKKSSVLTPERKIELKTRLNVQIPRIEKFFSTTSALLRDKTKEDVWRSVTAHPKRFLLKMKKEYGKSRYISSWRRNQLAQQLGTAQHIIKKWYSDWRILELLSLAPSISPACQDRDDSAKLPEQPTKKLAPHQRRILREEFKKNPFVSAIKARILADELNLTVERVNQFFKRKWRKNVVLKKPENMSDKKCKPVESNQVVHPSQLFSLSREFDENPNSIEER